MNPLKVGCMDEKVKEKEDERLGKVLFRVV